MTEQDWLTTKKPLTMLDRLLNWQVNGWHPAVSTRRLRLVAIAIFRTLQKQGFDFSKENLTFIQKVEDNPYMHIPEPAFGEPHIAPGRQGSLYREDAGLSDILKVGMQQPFLDLKPIERRALYADIFREIFGNIFQVLPHDCVKCANDCETGRFIRNNGTSFLCSKCNGAGIVLAPWSLDTEVINAATVIYNEKTFEELSILADLLEDLNCTNTELLSHLRSPGPHFRGCWALDIFMRRYSK